MKVIQCVPLLAAFLLVSASLPAQDKDKPHPIEAEVKSNLKDLTKPFIMIVHINVKEGNAAKFEAAFSKGRAGTRKEKGNLAYEMSRSTKNPIEYIVYERWTNFAALQTHLQAPHFKAMIGEIGELLDGPPSVKVFIPAGD
jgi:quinol monooxygenase YgiN